MKSMEEIKSNLRLNVIEDYGEQGLAAYYKHPHPFFDRFEQLMAEKEKKGRKTLDFMRSLCYNNYG